VPITEEDLARVSGGGASLPMDSDTLDRLRNPQLLEALKRLLAVR
jgi:hypothetical protein